MAFTLLISLLAAVAALAAAALVIRRNPKALAHWLFLLGRDLVVLFVVRLYTSTDVVVLDGSSKFAMALHPGALLIASGLILPCHTGRTRTAAR